MTAAALTLMAVRPTTSDVPGGRAPKRPFDDTRFEAFYRATAPRLWSYIARMTGDSTAADDLLQKTYFHFIRTNPNVENEDHMRRYLFRAATNIALDHLRERKRERGRPAGTPPPSVEGHDDLRRDMMRVFSELKPRERSAGVARACGRGLARRDCCGARRRVEQRPSAALPCSQETRHAPHEARPRSGGRVVSEDCRHEHEVCRASMESKWTDGLRAHVSACETCAAAAGVARWMAEFAKVDVRPRALPDPAIVWLKAQLVRGNVIAQRATLPITYFQIGAYVTIAAAWAALLTWNWESLQQWVLSLSPSSFIAGASAGASPLPATFFLVMLVLSSATVLLALHTILAEE